MTSQSRDFMRLVRLQEHGGPEVLRLEEESLPTPGPGEVAVDVAAIGLNRSEVMFRSGRHIEQALFPARLGYEAAGTIGAIADGVDHLRVRKG